MATLKELHAFAVDEGITTDPRDREQIEKEMEKRREAYKELEGVRKERYDDSLLENPYDDSQIVYGADQDVDTLAVGIDMEVPELLLVDRLNTDDAGIDGVLTHHPVGSSLARLHKVMPLMIDALHKAGVSISQAEAVVRPRVQEVARGVHGINHPRVPMTAERLDIPFFSLHTVADNHAHDYVKTYLEEQDPYTLKELVDTLLEIEEYQWALEYDMGPTIFVGSEENRVGNVAFDFTGGTELNKERLSKMATAGINTIVAMHMSKSQIEEAGEQNINVVSAGHMSSDSLGMNLVMDKLADKFGVQYEEFAGFKRVER